MEISPCIVVVPNVRATHQRAVYTKCTPLDRCHVARFRRATLSYDKIVACNCPCCCCNISHNQQASTPLFAFYVSLLHKLTAQTAKLLSCFSSPHAVPFLAPSVLGFLFVYEISREPLNAFAPNSHGKRV